MPNETVAEIRVRAATLADSVNVTKFCLKTGAWDGRSGPTNEKRVYQFVFGMISRDLVAIADLSGNVVGSIGCIAIQPTHTEQWSVYVDWLKVQSHLKDSGIARSLLRFALRIAKKNGSGLLLNLCDQDIEQIGADTMQEFGFEPTQRLWMRKADVNEQPRADQPATQSPEPEGQRAAVLVVEPPPGGAVGTNAVEPAPVPEPKPRSPGSRFRSAEGPTAGQIAAKKLSDRRAARALAASAKA
jgi:GNAT superfamily N-acetyltransferase